MKKNLLLISACALTLAACGSGGGSDYTSREAAPPAPPPPPVVSMERATSDVMGNEYYTDDVSGSSATDDLPQRAGRFLAYTHNRTISVPAADLRSILEAHAEQCQQAGPENCLVTDSNIYGLGTEYASGNLAMKASPEWALPFLENLPGALSELDATVSASSTSTIDLTSQIIDTDARLAAQTTLRDRLQALLENRDGDLGELLSVERELARVQAELDSYEAQMANLRQRVAMSDIYLNYQVRVSPVSQSVWRPLTEAFEDFFSNVALALGSIVTILAYVLPWLPVIVGLIWLFMFLFRKAFRKTTKAEATKATETKTGDA